MSGDETYSALRFTVFIDSDSPSPESQGTHVELHVHKRKVEYHSAQAGDAIEILT
jgi:hypothetical protein